MSSRSALPLSMFADLSGSVTASTLLFGDETRVRRYLSVATGFNNNLRTQRDLRETAPILAASCSNISTIPLEQLYH
ncbi:hypothetical protein I314_04435 [Cryptococcus bacillisporus CA1873]|uniref:Uncharacterized protein n=1 Tax=Cryptococcus bacillisporus CA1873 TaxID=1296111 RepID=A0ABR5B789_CRYGA|nr:hypothetical protein I314_04435 [Cryptococcus bacillisporus CA1873]|eukprot:KIR59451.1 hypothetical protein I314_04435 [Cryptococcus gattii CA1873]